MIGNGEAVPWVGKFRGCDSSCRLGAQCAGWFVQTAGDGLPRLDNDQACRIFQRFLLMEYIVINSSPALFPMPR
jgi:hypothetical protein